MARPTSFRLPEDLLSQLAEQGAADGTSVAALVMSILREGLRTRRFPGIVYRNGPTGRRAGLVGGPDVWEIIRTLNATPGEPESRVRALAEELGIPVQGVRLAVDFFAAFPGEIEERMAADATAASRLREVIDRRERLLSP